VYYFQGKKHINVFRALFLSCCQEFLKKLLLAICECMEELAPEEVYRLCHDFETSK